MQENDPIVIVSAKRTPMGGLLGAFKDTPAPVLGATAIQAALEAAQLDPQLVDDVIMGCVLSAGLGQAPARQAALKAGLSHHTGATTINKMCGSGLKALMMGADSILAGQRQCVVAGGLENMSQAPYIIPKARAGFRLGHGDIKDHMFLDGLEDAYEPGKLMGCYAEDTAQHYQITRKMQDDFALTSLERAQAAIENGLFKAEISPVTVKTRRAEQVIDTDEQPLQAKPDKIPQLKPAFSKDGTVTAANASSISDGAAALVIMRQSKAQALGCPILAKITAYATHAQEPAWFTTAPIGAMKQVLDKAGWHQNDVDLYEINEAFAVVTIAAMQELDLDPTRVNIHGGACALGHPIGASGARIVVTLLHALQQDQLQKGVASLCIGGGEAVAIAIERP